MKPFGPQSYCSCQGEQSAQGDYFRFCYIPWGLGKMKTTLPFTLRSDFQGRAGPSATAHPSMMQCQLWAPRLPPETPLSHRCLPLPAFQMAAGFLTSSPISLFPLGFHFSVILSHLFFSSWMMCRSFLQRLPTCSSRGLSDLPAAEALPASEDL